METPQDIADRVPPRRRASGSPFCCASISQNAFSRPALAISWPRTGASREGISEAEATCSPRRRGMRKSRAMSHAVAHVSELNVGASMAVISPQPVTPSERASTRRMTRSCVAPKLASKGAFKRMRSFRSVMASSLMSLLYSFTKCNKCCGVKRAVRCEVYCLCGAAVKQKQQNRRKRESCETCVTALPGGPDGAADCRTTFAGAAPQELVLGGIPAVSFALLFRDFLHKRKRRSAAALAERDADDDIVLVEGADEMRDAARTGAGENRQANQAQLILEILREVRGEVAGDDHDAAGAVEALGKGDQAMRVQAVFEPLEVLDVAFEGVADEDGHIPLVIAGLHGVERCGKGERQVVQVALEFAVAAEPKPADDAHDRGGIGSQALGHGANAKKHKVARMLENRADHFLALGAELVNAFGELRDADAGTKIPGFHPRENSSNSRTSQRIVSDK